MLIRTIFWLVTHSQMWNILIQSNWCNMINKTWLFTPDAINRLIHTEMYCCKNKLLWSKKGITKAKNVFLWNVGSQGQDHKVNSLDVTWRGGRKVQDVQVNTNNTWLDGEWDRQINIFIQSSDQVTSRDCQWLSGKQGTIACALSATVSITKSFARVLRMKKSKDSCRSLHKQQFTFLSNLKGQFHCN